MKLTIGVGSLLALALPQVHAQATPEACGAAFVGMQFALTNYAGYDNYFHNDSVMQLAQAGVYTGPAAIAEYVKFANPENPAIESRLDLNQTFALTGIEGDTCEFFSAANTHYVFSELFSNGTLNVSAAFRLYLNTTSMKWDRINVFYDAAYLRWFGGMTAFPAHQAKVCNEMESVCPNTWSSNNLSSEADCVSKLAVLPTTSGDAASFDGNVQMCRALHGVLAGFNPDLHCPHISFIPQEDPNGKFKCQSSSNIDASTLFTPAQMALFALFKAENGVAASGFAASIPCEIDAVMCPNDQVCVEGICAEPSANQPPAQATPEACGAAFVGMQFALTNYAGYDNYFHNDSVMQLAQAGGYTGPAAIAEYVKFANPENPAIESRLDLNQTFALTGIEGDTCEFFSAANTHYVFSELFSNGTLNVSAAFRLYLNTTSMKWDRINVFYDAAYLRWFGGMTAFPAHQAKVCNEMESVCPNTWSSNNLSSEADCVSKLAVLPTTSGDAASFDGNVQMCRALHGVLAGFNPDLHCPHISFIPQEDPNGKFKCQSSSNIDASTLFTPAQMALFALFKAENGVAASGFAASIPCEIDAVMCPNDQVCVEGICAEPMRQTTTQQPSSSTSTSFESDSSTALRMCRAILFLILSAMMRV
ncbi:ATP grasp domain protein [Amphidinium carterae]